MSKKIKFKKLQIPTFSRNDTNKSTTVTRFFTQTSKNYTTDNKMHELAEYSSSTVQSETSTISKLSPSLITNDEKHINKSIPNQNASPELQNDQNDVTSAKSISQNDSENLLRTSTILNNEHDDLLKCEESSSSTLKRKNQGKTSITKFFNESIDDFQTPAKQKKKMFKSNADNNFQQQKILKKRKRQPKINSMLLHNEMILSKMMNKQSIVDNVNPDEMQLALALSRSEIETSNSAECNIDGGNNVDLVATVDSPMNIGKLKKFKYKACRSNNEYDIPLFALSKSRGKWAHKFTALTLRNPENQAQKLTVKIEKFLNEQMTNTEMEVNDSEYNENYETYVTSRYLLNLKSKENNITRKNKLIDDNELNNIYYVTNLFTPSKSKPGNLLKNFEKIPGRDLSPVQRKEITLPKNINENNDNNNTSIENKQIIEDCNISQKSSECRQINLSYCNEGNNYDSQCHQHEEQNKRNVSPDLFAEYDETYYEKEIEKKTRGIESVESENDNIEEDNNFQSSLHSYEKFSSDDDDKDQIIERNIENFSERIYFENDENSDIIFDTENLCMSQSQSQHTENNEIEENPLKVSINDKNTKKLDFVDLTQDDSTSNEGNIEIDRIAWNNKNKENMNIGHILSSNQQDNINTNNLSPIFSSTFYSKSVHISNNEDDILFDSNFQYDKYESSRLATSLVKDSGVNSFTNSINKKDKIDINYSQNSFTNDCVIVLSDDEVNYSIKKANKIFESNIDDEDILSNNSLSSSASLNSNISAILDNSQQNDSKRRNTSNIHNFSLIDLISNCNEMEIEDDDNYETQKTVENLNIECASETDYNSPLKLIPTTVIDEEQEACMENPQIIEDDFDFMKMKKEFGILDEKTPIKNPDTTRQIHFKNSDVKRSLSESFLKSSTSNATRKSIKRFSTNEKFKEFDEENDFNDFDEFDKMVYGSPMKIDKDVTKTPEGIEQLLTAEINFNVANDENVISTTPKEITIDNKVYLIKTENIPEEPDYRNMDSPTRLKELCKYGLKSLKKKHAIIMLEYIYNQTHPFIEDNEILDDNMEKCNDQVEICHEADENAVLTQEEFEWNEINLKENGEKYDSLKLKDCFGDVLLEENDEILPETHNEEYYFPTNNSRTKITTTVLPLHLAWFNLVKSSYTLRETLLHYEPIDLQEIYIFFKKIGYRYNPKDMKKFFDSRCIIFRYDLNDGTRTNNRHTKKLFSKKSR